MQPSAAFGYPFRGPQAESGLVFGFVVGFVLVAALRLGVVGVLLAVVPALLFLGYVGRIAEQSVDGVRTLPDVRPLQGLLRPGLRIATVLAVFAVPPAVYLVAAQPVLLDTATTSSGTIDVVTFLVVSTSVLAVCSIFAYLAPAAAIHSTRTGSLRAAFSLAQLRPTVGDLSYLVNWTLAALLFAFVASLTAALLAADPRGGLVGIPLFVYVTFVSVHTVARSVGEIETSG